MPYRLCPPIVAGQPGFWGEGPAYERSGVYDFAADGPPVHYDAHTLRPHSLPHVESAGHVVAGGATVDGWFDDVARFVGPATVVRLTLEPGPPQPFLGRQVQHALIGTDALRIALDRTGTGPETLQRLLLDAVPTTPLADGTEFAFTLSIDAARWLCGLPRLALVGTRFRSTDFQPGRRERPIHRALFERGVAILECLDLTPVPEGRYVLVAPPLPLAGATETPVIPLLFTPEEWRAAAT